MIQIVTSEDTWRSAERRLRGALIWLAPISGGPMIPDAPHLPDWVLAYAEYGGRCVRLQREGDKLLSVGSGKPLCSCGPGSDVRSCPDSASVASAAAHLKKWPEHMRYAQGWPHGLPCVYRGTDEAEAWAAYRREADALMGREE